MLIYPTIMSKSSTIPKSLQDGADRRLVRLPKWAQQYIARLHDRVRTAEATIPWTEPGMEWLTLFRPDPQNRQAMERKPFMLFTCSEGGTHPVCDIGSRDFVFVGRGKPNASVVAPAAANDDLS